MPARWQQLLFSVHSLLLLCMPFVAVSALKLPQPDGQYRVGRRTFIWADETRPEDASIPDRSARHVAVFVFYPAAPGGEATPYYPGLNNLSDDAAAGLKSQFFGSWNDVRDGKVETSAFENPPMPHSTKPFPVLLFSPGLGVPALAYSIQLTELASHGYVIFALDHPYDTALVQLQEGKSIAFADRHAPKGPPSAVFFRLDAKREDVWVKDTQFVLRRVQKLNSEGGVFGRRLDLSKVGIFGHSMGGRVAVHACQLMKEAGACLNQDGGLFGVDFRSGEVISFVDEHASTNGPLLNIDLPIHLSPGDVDAEGEKIFNSWQAKKAKLLQGFFRQNKKPTYVVLSERSELAHGSFMDVRVLNALSDHKAPGVSLANLVLMNQVSLAFFDATLKGSAGGLKAMMRDGSSGLTISRLH